MLNPHAPKSKVQCLRQQLRGERFQKWFIAMRLRAEKHFKLRLEDLTKAEEGEYIYGEQPKP